MADIVDPDQFDFHQEDRFEDAVPEVAGKVYELSRQLEVLLEFERRLAKHELGNSGRPLPRNQYPHHSKELPMFGIHPSKNPGKPQTQ